MRRLLLALVFIGTSAATAPLNADAVRPQNPEPEEQGMASVAGVHVAVEADSWQGWPVNLTEVIPLLVTIENRSEMPVRLRYQEFALVPPNGRQRAALPPFEIQGAETTPVGTAGLATPYPYTVNGFLVAPHLAPYYPAFDPFAGPFAYDPFFYSTYYPAFRSIPLPTRDMVQKALPEGVLEPGGSITGFLYFQGDEEVPSEQATFHMDVVNASTNRAVGTALIPLEID